MNNRPLYKRIAQSIQQQILEGKLKPGERLVSVRDMALKWNCTPGTIQHAYQLLAQQGLITSRAGQGTKVVDDIEPALRTDAPLRRAALIHRAEAYFLEMLTAGYEIPEIEDAIRQAMDRWRVVRQESAPRDEHKVSFSGSHDIVISWIASHFSDISSGDYMELQFVGSLGGLIALAEGNADIAGSHLWDEESSSFNAPFVRRILPGRRIAIVTVANRRIGLVLPPGNPANIRGLRDLNRDGLRFINRQRGSGTRVWLDSALENLGISVTEIQGYDYEVNTHYAIAKAIADGEADVGIGLEAVVKSYGLDFIYLRHDRYDLIIPETNISVPPIAALVKWLGKGKSKELITSLGGYDVKETGSITWVQ
jgi:molybdate-binding protein/DNA-binding transcriptional regulator YhcF (GntR family)